MLFITYASLWVLAAAWALWRTVRAPSVRAGFGALPVAIAPAWGVTCLVAFNFGGWTLAAQTAGVAAASMLVLWAAQHGVQIDSGPVDDEYEEGRVGTVGDWPLAVQIAVIIGLYVFVALYLWAFLPR